MEQIKELVVKGKYRKIAAAVQNALDNGIHAESILQFMAEAMDTVGECFQKGEIFVPEMLIAAKTMKLGLDGLSQKSQKKLLLSSFLPKKCFDFFAFFRPALSL